MRFWLIGCLLYVGFGCNTSISNPLTTTNETEKTLLEQVEREQIPKSELRIFVDKSDRTLSVIHKEKTLITYPCVLGFAPEGDKMKQGDGKTPEGNFGIRAMYPHRSWSYFIWFDYPNAESQKRFAERKKQGIIPASAKIGGEVGIHGVPEGMDEAIDLKEDWTLGCISLKTAHITDLYKSISTETKLEIVP